jgi:hypothetical protein
MNDISKIILDKIKKEGLKPRPKWQFVLWHILLWSVFVLSILLGSLAFSVILGFLFKTEWDLVPHIGGGAIKGVLLVLPYVWFAALAVLLFVSNILFSQTKQGYKIRPVYVLVSSILISLILGVGFYFGEASEFIERGARENIPPYARLQERVEKMWSAPEKGVLAGNIVEITSDTIFILNAVTGEKWNVELDDEISLRKPKLQVGLPVIVKGEQTGEHEFLAEEVRPWKRMGKDGLLPPPPMQMPPVLIPPENL